MSENKTTVGFHYSIFAKSLEIQANDQGYTLGEVSESFQGTFMKIFDLHMEDLITDSQYDIILKKFHKRVIKALKRMK